MGAADIVQSTATGAATGSIGGPWGALAGAGIGLGAGILAYLVQSGAEADAQAIMEEAQRRYGAVTDEALRQAAADVLGPSALTQITQDPKFAKAQDAALAALDDIARSGGITANDRAALNEVTNATELARLRSAETAAASLSRGGLYGSGAAIQMQQADQQAAANRESQAGLNIYGQAQQRALDAIASRGQLAGQMQAADWSRQADAARAQDLRDQANWGNRQSVYRAQMGQAQDQLGFAGQRAGYEQAAGTRQGQMIAGVGNGVGRFLAQTDALRAQPQQAPTPAPQPHSTTPDEEYLYAYAEKP